MAIKVAIYDWLADERREQWPGIKGKLAVVTDAPETDWEEAAWDDDSLVKLSPEQLLAVGKNFKLKAGKSKGMGDRSSRKCLECQAEDYIAANCPAHAARVAAEAAAGEDITMGGGKSNGLTMSFRNT